MFIKSLIEDVSALIHKGKSYPVVNSVADVPKEVRDEVITYGHWQDNTEAIDDITLNKLDLANRNAEKANQDNEKEKTLQKPEQPTEPDKPVRAKKK